MTYFNDNEKDTIIGLKRLTVPQVCYYGKFPKRVVYVLIKNAKEISFPVLPRTYHKKQYFIHTEKFIEWMDKLYDGKVKIAHLFDK